MSSLSKEAQWVHAALVERGLETPLRESKLSPSESKQQIEHHMTEVMKLLNLDLSDD
ncbi:MAG: GTP cyclohydrolase I FolE, partial [Proteus vulgaris]